MKNKLISNKTIVYFTVWVNEVIAVQSAEVYSGKVIEAKITQKEERAYKYQDGEIAQRVAKYVNGQVLKHTQTATVTEITEKLESEDK